MHNSADVINKRQKYKMKWRKNCPPKAKPDIGKKKKKNYTLYGAHIRAHIYSIYALDSIHAVMVTSLSCFALTIAII